MSIRLVTFDILHTLITPRRPIHVQYSMEFAPYLGALDPDIIKASFKSALKTLQREKPAYEQGSQVWWSDVIRRTALGAGADRQALDTTLDYIVENLMKRFRSGQGYKVFDDAFPTLQKLQKLNIRTGCVSNSDSRSRSVLLDVGLSEYLAPIILSEEESIEKPSPEIFLRALRQVNDDQKTAIRPEECLHVGDELECDYKGAMNAGMKALLLRRPGKDGEQAHIEEGELLAGVEVIDGLKLVLSKISPTP